MEVDSWLDLSHPGKILINFTSNFEIDCIQFHLILVRQDPSSEYRVLEETI